VKEKLQKYLEEKNFKNQDITEKCMKILESDRYKEDEVKEADITLKELSVNKFMGIDNEIEYKNRIINITGPNTSGKTFLAENPRMMLCNSGRTIINKLLEKETYTKLRFNVNEKEYELAINKAGWNLYTDEDPLTPFKKGQTEVLKHFKAIGIDESLDKLIFIKNEGSYITEQDPAVFKEYVLGMGGTGNLTLIKKDINNKIVEYEKDIENKKGKIEGLKSDEGINSITFEIETLKKDVKDEKKLKDELLNITTNGADVVAKKLKEIEELKSKRTVKEETIERIDELSGKKDVFKNHKKANDKFKKAESEYDKLQKEKDKILKNKKEIEIELEAHKSSLEKLKSIDQKCPTCESEIPDIKKKVMIKDKQDKIDVIEKALLTYNNKKFEDIISPETLKGAIDEYEKVIEGLKETGIKSEKELNEFLEKNNKSEIEKEITKLNDSINKKQSEYDKLVETDNSKRKEEIENKLEDIKKSEIKLATLNEKLKTLKDSDKKINDIKNEIETIRNDIEVLHTIFKIFDKNNKESFPAWLIKERLKDLTVNINKELERFKFDHGKLNVEINDKFEFITRGYRSKSLSNSENRILNIAVHSNLLLLKYKAIPFLIVDDYSMALDKNIKLELNSYLNELIKEEKIKNLILTDPSTDKLKVDYLKKI
jgi:hypothetical protein